MSASMVIRTWDNKQINDGTDYVSGFVTSPRGLPKLKAALAGRAGRWPLLAGLERSGRTLDVEIVIVGEDLDALQTQLEQWFDPEDETPKLLLVDEPGAFVFVEAICEELREEPGSGGTVWLARLVVHGDVRWRAQSEQLRTAAITNGVSADLEVDVTGEDVVFPRFEIEPAEAKVDSYPWKRWAPVRWRVSQGAQGYPVDIADGDLDTASLVSASKMQADGDDLRVWVNGKEVDRWLDDMDSAGTAVWVNLNFKAKQEAGLAAAIAGSGAVDTIDVEGVINGFPEAGILMIEDEAFLYTGKNNVLRRFVGVTRAARGTSMAAHSAGETVWWVQHDIWILYGNASADAPVVDDSRAPMFELASSSNTVWDYDDFVDRAGRRTGRWRQNANGQRATFYTGDGGVLDDPASEMGIHQGSDPGEARSARWYLHNPCGIVSANFQNGEKRVINPAALSGGQQTWRGAIESTQALGTWTLEHDITPPSAADAWESWSRNETLVSGATIVGMRLICGLGYPGFRVASIEVADVTVTLNSSNTPVASVGGEQGNYELDLTITNLDDANQPALRVRFLMELDEVLVVDTANKTVTYEGDGQQYFGAVEVLGDVRRDWLPLAPPATNLRFEEAGAQLLRIRVIYRARYYG